MTVSGPFNAFMDCDYSRAPKKEGALSGLTFAVKDIFDIAGRTAGCGNPRWLETHSPAGADAWAVSRLSENGCLLKGVTITDEIAFSLNGENHHYGTPQNPNAPDRIPGGSSSGSAVAVAAGLADTALGTDTGGSIRVPASFCGIFGLRPTHSRVPLAGVMPLAPSFDTVGWFARSPKVLKSVGDVLLNEKSSQPSSGPLRLLMARDAFDLADAAARESLAKAASDLRPAFAGVTYGEIADEKGFEPWLAAFRVLQGWEIWRAHGKWISETSPEFGPGVRERMQWVSGISDRERDSTVPLRMKIRERMDELTSGNTLIAIPSAPDAAPLLNMPSRQVDDFRQRALQLTAIAGLSGLPQISMPLAQTQHGPVGLSLIGWRGGDEVLLDLAQKLTGQAGKGLAPIVDGLS